MNQTQTANAIHDLSEPLSHCFDAASARRLAEYRIAPAVQARMEILADRSTEGLLTDEERDEYMMIINTVEFISLLKLKVARHLRSGGI